MADPERIEAELQRGAERARAIARPLLARLREAVGLRRSRVLPGQAAAPAPKSATPPVVKQYREADGQFYVKLTQGDEVLALSPGFASGRDGAQWLAGLKGGEAVTLAIGSEAPPPPSLQGLLEKETRCARLEASETAIRAYIRDTLGLAGQ
jgi:tryptophanyl-tRNA synthetase